MSEMIEENNKEDENNEEATGATSTATATTSANARLCRLPMARVKSIMKMDPEVQLASGEAVYLITRLTEMFIDTMAKEAYSYTAKAKRKVISKNDLDAAIENIDCLCFLEGAMDF